MSDNFWDESVYAEVEREAHADWLRERPAPDVPSPSEFEPCEGCGQYVCTEECES